MPNPAPLSEVLQASLDYIREKKRQQMTQAIAQYHEPVSELTTWQAMREQASELVKSGFLPKAVNTPEKAMAIIQTGKELGLGPMQSLRGIHIIDGKPTMSADLIAGLALSKVPGSVLRVAASTDTECTIKAGRSGHELTTFTYTIEDAKRAGLTGKQNWRNYPRAMLRARALTEAARAIFPDAVMGLYDPDELGAVTNQAGEIQVTDVTPRNDTGGAYNVHQLPGEASDAPGDPDLIRGLYSRFATIETDLDTCDSWEKAVALRGLLGTRAQQSDLTRTMQLKAEAGDIRPTQRAELGKTWMRCNRKLEKLEATHKPPPVEASFVDPKDDAATDAFSPTREPGSDDE